MVTITRPVTGLPATDRQVLEHLLGRTLSGGQQVVIMAFSPGMQNKKTRVDASHRIKTTLAQAAVHARETGVSTAEADAAVDEAMQHVRHRS